MNLLAIDYDRANQLVVFEHRDGNQRSRAAKLGRRPGMAFRPFIDRENKLFCLQKTIKRGTLRRAEMPTPTKKFFVLQRHARPGRGVKLGTLGAEEDAEVGFTYPHCVRQHSVKDRIEFARRRADDLEHVGGGRLLLQRLTQLVEQSRVLDRDDGLRGEVLKQLDLSRGEGAQLLAVDDDGADELVVLEHR